MKDESKTGSSPQVSSEAGASREPAANHEPQANCELKGSSESETSYPHPLLTMWRVLLSLPLAMVWMSAFFLVFVGWGLKAADGMLAAWNEWAGNWE